MIRTADDLTQLAEPRHRLLAVFAHPDDESYGCAGALSRYGRRPDVATVLLCLTRGEASSMGRERGLSPEAVGALRTERLERVGAIVGLDALLVGDLPDGRLARLPLAEVAAPIAAALRTLRPTVVIVHDARGVNGHPDHVASHWATRRALEGQEGVRLALVAYGPDVVEMARPRLIFPTAPDEMDAVLELDEAEIDAKQACLDVHDAVITLRPNDRTDRPVRPATECFDFLGEDLAPPAAELL